MKYGPYVAKLAALCTTLMLVLSACESSDSNGPNDSTAGSGNSTAGAASTGGKSSSTSVASKGGDTSSAGGASLAGASSGGASAVGSSTTGGTSASGGTTSTTGSNASGGTSATSGSNVGGTSATSSTSTVPVTIALSESAHTFATPDISYALTATLTGAAASTITWTSSNTYIATVKADPLDNTKGIVTSVSGGTATITASSSVDPTKTATAGVTISEPNRPRATTYVDAKSIQTGPVKIFMVGDSLMRTYVPSSSDQTGWGQVLNQFMTADVTVDNTLSNGGRSSRSFYNEVGRWNEVKTRLAAAKTAGTPSFVFIMFGHNDEKKITDTDGALYLTFAATNPNGTVAGTFYDYLERYIVETRELGGIPVLLTPFVRQYLAGTPATITDPGRHVVTVPYAGETTARGDYPAAMKAVATKHDVPIVDITAWSKAMVEARAVENSLGFIYIASDQTHVRNLGALLMAQEAMRSLNAAGILTPYAKTPSARVMLDASTLSFGGIYTGNSVEQSFRISPFSNVTGTLTVTAPAGYTVSTDGTTFNSTATINCDGAYFGTVVTVRFTPTDAQAYNANLTIAHSTLTPDYGNTVPSAVAGVISLTGNGKVAVSGAPATATWAMFSGTTITKTAVVDGAIGGTTATLTGLIDKNVANGAARFDTTDGTWPPEGARNAARYVEFTVPVTTGTFNIDSISVGAGTAGGSNIHWDIVYSLTPDFASPTVLGSAIGGAKDVLVTSSYASLGFNVTAGQTLYLRVYPYNSSSAALTGKSVMVANVIVSGVTN